MALPTPPRYTNPIPNNPFYYPEGNFLYGDTGPLIVGSGLNIDYTTGVISAAGGGGGVTSIFAGPGIGVNANTGVVTITNTGVTSITTGAGLTGGPITTTGTISLGTTGVTPGNYTLANITVDAQGRISTASNGTAVLSVTGTAPVNVTTGVNPTISIAPSSTSSAGIVQLNNTLSSNSITEALTAAQGQILQNQINSLSVATNLTFAGTFDASLAHMDSVTTEGAAEGFTLGADLPAPAASNDNFFVIVTTEGTYSPPGGGGPYAANRGDWFLSNGTTWEYLNVGADLPVASTGSQGIVELATVAETQAGTSTTLAVTPAGLAASLPDATPFVAGVVKGRTNNTNGNMGLGCCALASVTTGMANSALGQSALQGLTSGQCNVAVGSVALNCLTNGCFNVAVGPLALYCAGSNCYNTAIGFKAQERTTTGTFNTGVGGCALFLNMTGHCNTGVGFCSVYSGSGSYNVGVGYNTIPNAVGSYWLGIGFEAGCCQLGGERNVIIGPQIWQAPLQTGSCQLAIGFGNNCCWLTGCPTRSIRPAAGIMDCAGSTGTAGQVLQSNGANAVCWGTIASTAAATPTTLGTMLGCTTALNSALGCNALVGITTGLCNVAAGNGALSVISSGCVNVGVGSQAMNSLTTGSRNVAVGALAGDSLTSGIGNTLLGYCAAQCLTTGCYNVAVGHCASCNLQSGADNTSIGHCSGYNLISGCRNLALGTYVTFTNPSDSCQLAIGFGNGPGAFWLKGNSTGAIQPGGGIIDCAGSCGTNGQVLVSNGANAVCWGSPACAIPTAAGIVFGCSGGTNTSLGLQALCSVFSLTGADNTAVGYRSAVALSGFAFQNTAVGACSLQCATVGDDNVAIGWKAAFATTTGSSNVALGSQAMACSSSGSANVGIGNGALLCNVTSNGNTAVGHLAAQNATGACNTAVGHLAMPYSTTGSYNTALGADNGLSLIVGSNNTLLGACAGLTNGNNNVLVGFCSRPSSTLINNEVSIFNGCTAAGTARFQGNAGAWSFASDVRKKEDIVPLALGIDFVNDLQPRKFAWKETKEEAAGFIAQEVDAVVTAYDAGYLELVNKDDQESWMLAQTKIIPVLVKAIQELSAKVNELEAKLAANG